MSRKWIEEQFHRYGPMVYRRALFLLGRPSEAEDVVQDVFIKLVRERGGFRGESKVSTWLYRLTTNHCLNILRDSKNRRRLLEEKVAPSQSPLPGAMATTEAMGMRRLLAEANPEDAQAAVCVFVDGMTRPEAAETLGVSLRTVGNRLSRFRSWALERLGDSDELASRLTSEGESGHQEVMRDVAE